MFGGSRMYRSAFRQAQLMGISETVAAPASPGRPYNKDSRSLCLILARRVPTVKRIKRSSKGQPQPLLLKRDGENWETLPACPSRPSRTSRPSRVKHTMRAVEDHLARPQERIQKSSEHYGEKRLPGQLLAPPFQFSDLFVIGWRQCCVKA